MYLNDVIRNLPFYDVMVKDTEITRQEISRNDQTGESVIINHRRYKPGSLQAKRIPLGK